VRNRELALRAAKELMAEPGSTITVEAIAHRAGLGAATVVRAFGNKDSLLDAAVAALLAPIAQRAGKLSESLPGEQALRTFLPELMEFHATHYAIDEQLLGLELPATSEAHAALISAVEQMITQGRKTGGIRSDLDSGVIASLIAGTTHAVTRSTPRNRRLSEAYVSVLMDGLAPRPA